MCACRSYAVYIGGLRCAEYRLWIPEKRKTEIMATRNGKSNPGAVFIHIRSIPVRRMRSSRSLGI